MLKWSLVWLQIQIKHNSLYEKQNQLSCLFVLFCFVLLFTFWFSLWQHKYETTEREKLNKIYKEMQTAWLHFGVSSKSSCLAHPGHPLPLKLWSETCTKALSQQDFSSCKDFILSEQLPPPSNPKPLRQALPLLGTAARRCGMGSSCMNMNEVYL